MLLSQKPIGPLTLCLSRVHLRTTDLQKGLTRKKPLTGLHHLNHSVQMPTVLNRINVRHDCVNPAGAACASMPRHSGLYGRGRLHCRSCQPATRCRQHKCSAVSQPGNGALHSQQQDGKKKVVVIGSGWAGNQSMGTWLHSAAASALLHVWERRQLHLQGAKQLHALDALASRFWSCQAPFGAAGL